MALSPKLNNSLSVLKDRVRHAVDFLAKHPCSNRTSLEVTGALHDSDSAVWSMKIYLQFNRDTKGGHQFDVIYFDSEKDDFINQCRVEDLPLAERITVYSFVPEFIEQTICSEGELAEELIETADKIEQAIAFRR